MVPVVIYNFEIVYPGHTVTPDEIFFMLDILLWISWFQYCALLVFNERFKSTEGRVDFEYITSLFAC